MRHGMDEDRWGMSLTNHLDLKFRGKALADGKALSNAFAYAHDLTGVEPVPVPLPASSDEANLPGSFPPVPLA